MHQPPKQEGGGGGDIKKLLKFPFLVEEGIIGSITNTGKYTQEDTLVKHR